MVGREHYPITSSSPAVAGVAGGQSPPSYAGLSTALLFVFCSLGFLFAAPCPAVDAGSLAPLFCLTNINARPAAEGVIPPAGRWCLKHYVGPRATSPAYAVLLSFFATWCAPCVAELPFLQGLQQRYAAKGLRTLVVNVEQEHEDTLRSFLADKGIVLPVVKDVHTILMQRYKVTALPNLFLIDGQGTVRLHLAGFDEGSKTLLEARLQGLLP